MAPVALCHASSLGASCRWVLDGRLVPGARAIHVRLVRRGPGIGPRIRLDRPHDGLRRARQSGRGRPALSPGGLLFRPGSLRAFGTSVRVGGGHLARRVGERVRRRQHLRGRRLSGGSLQPRVCAWALIRDQSARAPWAHGAVLPYTHRRIREHRRRGAAPRPSPPSHIVAGPGGPRHERQRPLAGGGRTPAPDPIGGPSVSCGRRSSGPRGRI